jgi:site-specific DNA-methyltransferase (adenine-specific)
MNTSGRYPSNVSHGGSDGVLAMFPEVANLIGGTILLLRQAEQGGERRTQRPPERQAHGPERYLCRLVTPLGGTVLDPFIGSGSTGVAATAEGFNFVGIDIDPRCVEIAKARLSLDDRGQPTFNFRGRCAVRLPGAHEKTCENLYQV